jgi:hypothetical protein
MLRLLADENFNGDIVRGLLLFQPDLDMIRVQDAGLAGAADPDLLAWAARNHRIVLTHDRATMPGYAYERVAAGENMPGVFIFDDRFAVGQAIQEILLMIACTCLYEGQTKVRNQTLNPSGNRPAGWCTKGVRVRNGSEQFFLALHHNRWVKFVVRSRWLTTGSSSLMRDDRNHRRTATPGRHGALGKR